MKMYCYEITYATIENAEGATRQIIKPSFTSFSDIENNLKEGEQIIAYRAVMAMEPVTQLLYDKLVN